jgi:hypothetical protein
MPRYSYAKRARLFQVAVKEPSSSFLGGGAASDEGIGQNPAMSPTDPAAAGNDREVLGSLPKTRPERRSSKRDRPARSARPAAGPGPKAPAGAKRRAAKPATAERTKAATKPATAERTKAATKPATAERTKAATKPAAGAKRPKATASKSAARTKIGADAKTPTRARKAPASGASKPVPPAGYAAPRAGKAGGPGDLMGTAVQAAGELAEIGATLAGQALRSALRRLPRP